MTYKKIEEQREYQLKYYYAKKAEFFSDKKCRVCGGTESLRLMGPKGQPGKYRGLFSRLSKQNIKILRKALIFCRKHWNEERSRRLGHQSFNGDKKAANRWWSKKLKERRRLEVAKKTGALLKRAKEMGLI